ncbi:hypothetical protein [Salinicoccus sp. HZC-1]
MKKFLLASGFSTVLILGACGTDEEPAPSDEPASNEEPTTEENSEE